MLETIFLLAVATLFTHELDAMRCKEWRFLPVFRSLPDPQGERAFIIVHVLLFAGLIWLGWNAQHDLREMGRLAIGAFCVVHVGLHWLFRAHPAYAFTDPISKLLIWGAGVLGALYLGLRMLVG